MRQSKAFLYCMHKNLVITLTLFWFSYYTALSGTSPYESWIYGGYNFALGWPIVFLGILNFVCWCLCVHFDCSVVQCTVLSCCAIHPLLSARQIPFSTMHIELS